MRSTSDLVLAVRDLTVHGLTAMHIARELGVSIGYVHSLRWRWRRESAVGH